jgi:hypothetical protein
MLYIFAGFPRNGLHAGGLRFAIEEVEDLAILERDPSVQYRKEGIFTLTPTGEEWIAPVDYLLSPLCLRDGITWDWFPENWTFGNGVTVSKTMASPEYGTVVYGTDLTMDEFLAASGPANLSDLRLERKHIVHEGWMEYEARWVPGTCPQENHVVHLTWLITTHPLPEFAYRRVRELIEETAELKKPDSYSAEDGKHFSASRCWNGKPAYTRIS